MMPLRAVAAEPLAHKGRMHIIFTGGGTLGPVTPLIAVMHAIRAKRPDATFAWIGTEDGPEARVVREAGIDFRAIPAGKLRRYMDGRNLTDLVRIMRGVFEARRILKEVDASAVVSAGGFVAVPVAWAARSLGIPVHVHQQDVIPGLANKLTIPVAGSMSVALESSLDNFKKMQPVWTGNPVRSVVATGSRDEAIRVFGLDASVPTILAMGGGTGAARLNELVRGALPALLAHANVIHVAGPGKAEGERRAHRYAQEELLTDTLPHALAAADVVVTRAGMGALTELASLGKPVVIVPMADSHQEANAVAYARASGAPFVAETKTDLATFAKVILDLLADEPRRAAIGKGMAAMHRPDAAARIADTVIALAE